MNAIIIETNILNITGSTARDKVYNINLTQKKFNSKKNPLSLFLA